MRNRYYYSRSPPPPEPTHVLISHIGDLAARAVQRAFTHSGLHPECATDRHYSTLPVFQFGRDISIRFRQAFLFEQLLKRVLRSLVQHSSRSLAENSSECSALLPSTDRGISQADAANQLAQIFVQRIVAIRERLHRWLVGHHINDAEW